LTLLIFVAVTACDSQEQSEAAEKTEVVEEAVVIEQPEVVEKPPIAENYRVAGKYFLEKEPRSSMELNANGDFTVVQWRKFKTEAPAYTGTYVVVGHQITMTLDSGRTFKVRLDGDSIIDKDRNRWDKW
jgi:hypothetical protein